MLGTMWLKKSKIVFHIAFSGIFLQAKNVRNINLFQLQISENPLECLQSLTQYYSV